MGWYLPATSWSRCRGKNCLQNEIQDTLLLVPSAVEDFVTTLCSLHSQLKRVNSLSRNSAGAGRCSLTERQDAVIALLQQVGSRKEVFEWIPSPVPAWCAIANCACAVLGCPHSKWEMAGRMFLCQDPLHEGMLSRQNWEQHSSQFHCPCCYSVRLNVICVPCQIEHRPQTWRVLWQI